MTETELKTLLSGITPPDEAARAAAHAHWAGLAKPLGGLGALETLLEDAAALTGSAALDVSHRAVLVLCSDNGVVAQGVSQTDQSVTRAVAENLAARRTSVCQMARTAHCDVVPVDMGMAGDPVPGVADCRIAAGTADFTQGPAMTRAQAVEAVGRGIRLVSAPNEMTQAYALAVAEGEASFGDGSVYMEKYVHPARHIEVQVLADEAGNVVCLGERDCSVQRHHQKLIEESPSPAVSRSQRKKLMELTARAVKAIGYVGVGTLEFLLDRDGRFWFMEMNLRLQVEHGVTEMLTQVDLVKWQIRTAAGVPLNFQQQNVALNGACVECRINALTPGTLSMLHVPGGPFVRFDTYLVSGISVSPYYDALLGKLIVYAGTREEAMRKMKAALCELVVEGIETNIAEQLELVSDPRFMTGQYDLTFMEGR